MPSLLFKRSYKCWFLCLPGRTSQTLLETYQVHGVVKTKAKTIFGKCFLGWTCAAWAGRWMDSQL